MGLGAAMALGDPPADYASIAAVGLFVALMCVCIVVGHLLEENRWMNESITTLFIGLGTRAVILFASSEKHSRVLVFSEDLLFIYLLPPIIFNAGNGIRVLMLCALGLISRLNIGALELGDYLGVVNDTTSVVLFNAIHNFDPGNISGAKLLNFISSFLYLFGSNTILGVASGLLSAYTIKKLYFGRHAFATLSFISETFLFLYVGMDALEIEKWKIVGQTYRHTLSLFLSLHCSTRRSFF
ncbi:Sodium/hydrogen exchanger 2 [Zea mays]|uniref:Sodium/hydrogen exchanger 2 n=1 Tax=Zea mays TaxID=4577 RepID=A0A1D6EB58_MAIZE|nr:Sodium/hydrogen exchanger 2 [Zea mays]